MVTFPRAIDWHNRVPAPTPTLWQNDENYTPNLLPSKGLAPPKHDTEARTKERLIYSHALGTAL